MRNNLVAGVIALLLVAVAGASAEPAGFIKPAPQDKCPVCGMFVAKYPDFVAEIVFKDGSYAVFDGAKDLFKYYHDLARYDHSRKASDIRSIFVTDYYEVQPIDAVSAFFVVGSDVYGPMGRELIAFATANDAQEFMKDHAGKQVLRFGEVSAEVVKTLD